MAQLVAHLHGMQRVRGSSPLSSTDRERLVLLRQDRPLSSFTGRPVARESFLDLFQKSGRMLRMATEHDFPHLLREAALRVTRPRVAVLAAVHAHPHADTDTIIGAVRRELPDVSHQTVYDSLHTLTGTGLVRRIQPAGSVARYESRVDDNHHHVVCRSCGAIADVDCAVGHTPCLTASADHGFVVDEAEVVYWGTCPACTTAALIQ